jgi:hypothetical protein
MRSATIALIEFHWLAPAPARPRKAAPAPRRPRPAPVTGGYQLPGGNWRAFLGDELCCGGSPIVFLHVLPAGDADPPPPRAVWHRIH